MEIRTVKAVTSIAIIICAIDLGTAKPLPNVRTNGDSQSRLMKEVPDIVDQRFEEIEKRQKECYQLKGKFYSFNTHECESCEKHCPNGTDITLCGQECVGYYANKSLNEMRENSRNSRNELKTGLIQSLKDNANITKNYFLNLKEHLLKRDEEISDLKKENKDLANKLESTDNSVTISNVVSISIIIGMLIGIGLVVFFGRKYMKKQSHSRLHDQASDDKFNPSNSKDSGIDQPEGDAESAPLTHQNRAKSRSQMTITEDNETIHQ